EVLVKARIRLGEMEDHRLGVGRVDALNANDALASAEGLVLHHRVDGVLDICRAERLPVVPMDPVSERHLPGGVFGCRVPPLPRQTRHPLLLGGSALDVVVQQRLIDDRVQVPAGLYAAWREVVEAVGDRDRVYWSVGHHECFFTWYGQIELATRFCGRLWLGHLDWFGRHRRWYKHLGSDLRLGSWGRLAWLATRRSWRRRGGSARLTDERQANGD